MNHGTIRAALAALGCTLHMTFCVGPPSELRTEDELLYRYMNHACPGLRQHIEEGHAPSPRHDRMAREALEIKRCPKARAESPPIPWIPEIKPTSPTSPTRPAKTTTQHPTHRN